MLSGFVDDIDKPEGLVDSIFCAEAVYGGRSPLMVNLPTPTETYRTWKFPVQIQTPETRYLQQERSQQVPKAAPASGFADSLFPCAENSDR
jgi:hypothetical protein